MGNGALRFPKGVLCLLNNFEDFDEEANNKTQCSEKPISAENIVQNIAESIIKTLKNGLQSATDANTQNADEDLTQQDGADTDEADTNDPDVFDEDVFGEDLLEEDIFDEDIIEEDAFEEQFIEKAFC